MSLCWVLGSLLECPQPPTTTLPSPTPQQRHTPHLTPPLPTQSTRPPPATGTPELAPPPLLQNHRPHALPPPAQSTCLLAAGTP
ncbi:hypothetical protein B0H10DRAFT_2218748 [Mycena sp. CBHHK59/15]|nr:hypothetical protein B0H10DRAFT_2218748 [Mycena sp. CBHHK59/15]